MIQFAENFATPGWGEIPAPVRSRPGAFGGECLSFAPNAGAHFAGVWGHWVEHVYGAQLVDAMLAVMLATRLDHTRDPLVLDAQVALYFAPEVVLRLRRAGHAMLRRMDGMRGSRSALRLRLAAERGETPGLYPIVFALQSAIYNVPARAALIAYARLEWRAARDSHGGPWDEPGQIANELIFSQVDTRLPPRGSGRRRGGRLKYAFASTNSRGNQRGGRAGSAVERRRAQRPDQFDELRDDGIPACLSIFPGARDKTHARGTPNGSLHRVERVEGEGRALRPATAFPFVALDDGEIIVKPVKKRRDRPSGLTLVGLDAFLVQLLRQIPECADPGDNKLARARLFSPPTRKSDAKLKHDWEHYVHPELRSLFQTARDTVVKDLSRMKPEIASGSDELAANAGAETTFRLQIPSKLLRCLVECPQPGDASPSGPSTI